MSYPVSFYIHELRPVSTTLQGISDAIVENINGSLTQVLDADELQQTGGPSPVYEGVQPFSVKVNNVTLAGNPSESRLHQFQDKSGTVALLDDVYGIRPTVILREGLVSVDWNVGDNFLVVLSGNRQSTFYMYHSEAGMSIDLLLINNGTNQTVYAWDPDIKWPDGSPPTIPAANSGTSAMLLVTIENINGIMYGESVNYTSAEPVPL